MLFVNKAREEVTDVTPRTLILQIEKLEKQESSDATDDSDDGEEEESEEKPKVTRTKRQLKPTPYDGIVMAMSCLCDLQYTNSRGFSAVLLLFLSALIILVLNTVIQFMLVFSLLVSTVHDEAAPYEDRAHVTAMTIVINNAIAAGTPLSLGNETTVGVDASRECHNLKTLPYMHLIVLFLWFTKMLNEFMDAFWRIVYVWGQPLIYCSRGPLLETGEHIDELKFTIIASTRLIRFAFTILVAVPQVVLAMMLGWAGAKYLFFATDMGKLVMKAISLAFITQVDELLFAAFASQRFKELVGKGNYAVQPIQNFHMILWGTSAIKFGLGVSVTWMVWSVCNGPVTQLRQACYAYQKTFPPAGATGLWATFVQEMFSSM